MATPAGDRILYAMSVWLVAGIAVVKVPLVTELVFVEIVVPPEQSHHST
jgi:hypothetical protein